MNNDFVAMVIIYFLNYNFFYLINKNDQFINICDKTLISLNINERYFLFSFITNFFILIICIV